MREEQQGQEQGVLVAVQGSLVLEVRAQVQAQDSPAQEAQEPEVLERVRVVVNLEQEALARGPREQEVRGLALDNQEVPDLDGVQVRGQAGRSAQEDLPAVPVGEQFVLLDWK